MIFGRRPQPARGSSSFWDWWTSSGAAEVDRAIESKGAPEFADVISSWVNRVQPGADWETSPGAAARHRLTLSSAGDPAARRVLEKWRRAAPAPDGLWEYRTAREADPHLASNAVEIGGNRLKLDSFAFVPEVDEQRLRVHVMVHHPEFAGMAHDDRLRMAYLSVDWSLGEDTVERWVGEVSTTVGAPVGAVNFAGLRDAVSVLSAANTRDDWRVATYTFTEGDPLLLTVRSIRWIDEPLFDLHHEVRFGYRIEHSGWPTPEELTRLSDSEGRITQAAPHAVLVAYTNRSGVRTLHYYSDSDDESTAKVLSDAVRHEGGKLTSRPDPGWRAVRDYLG